jgi:hypothetical protein
MPAFTGPQAAIEAHLLAGSVRPDVVFMLLESRIPGPDSPGGNSRLRRLFAVADQCKAQRWKIVSARRHFGHNLSRRR